MTSLADHITPNHFSLPLSPEHLAHLRTSGLTDETIRAAGIYSLTTPEEVARALGRRSWHEGGGIAIPVYLPGRTEPHHLRVRPDVPRVEMRDGRERPQRYEGPIHTRSVYFGPRARRGEWSDGEIAIVEGEKKCLLLDQLGWPAVGIVGCWGGHDVEARRRDGSWILHPWIREHVPLAGRQVVYIADSDAQSSSDVRGALHRLLAMLRAAGATVRVIVVPAGPDGAKQGIDDHYVREGEDATRALLAPRPKVIPLPLRPEAPAGTRVPSGTVEDDETRGELPIDGEPIVLYSRTRQTPVHYYLPRPEALAEIAVRQLGAAKKRLLERVARIAKECQEYGGPAGVATQLPRHYYPDGAAYLGSRGLARAIGSRSHTTVRAHLEEMERDLMIEMERPCGAPRKADTIRIRPWWWCKWSEWTSWTRDDIARVPSWEWIPRGLALDLVRRYLATYDLRTGQHTWEGRTYPTLSALWRDIDAMDQQERAAILDRLRAAIPADADPIRYQASEAERNRILHVPAALAEMGLVSDTALDLYTAVIYEHGSLGPRPLDRAYLALRIGLSSADGVRRYERELVEAQLIEVRPGRRGRRLIPLMHPWLRAPGALRRGRAPRPWSSVEPSSEEAE